MRLNFLNWRPDAEPFGNEGLTKATNTVHDTEGWRPIHLKTTTSFSTTGGLAASVATVLSCVAKPVGTQGDLFCAWLSGSPPTLHVGINGVTAAAVTSAAGSVTGYPLSFSTLSAQNSVIWGFDVTEYAGKIFFTVEARQTENTTETAQKYFCGYMDF